VTSAYLIPECLEIEEAICGSGDGGGGGGDDHHHHHDHHEIMI